MKKMITIAIALSLSTHGLALAQIKPETSGKPSLSEPEPDPKAEGDYRPNEAGQPAVGATAREGARVPNGKETSKDPGGSPSGD